MKILIEVPTWLGDSVMTTPAIENILQAYPQAKLTLFGSFVSTQALQVHPRVEKVIVDDSKKAGFRFKALYRLAKSLGDFESAFTFRRTMTSRFFIFFVSAKKRYYYRRFSKEGRHQVLRYNDFINHCLKRSYEAEKLRLHYLANSSSKPLLGINPGATYGSAKRWYPERFGEVAKTLSLEFDILLFGGPSEVDMARDIERYLVEQGVENFHNLAGKTSIPELIEHIGSLSLFITADSGPMHVAAAYQIPTVALFGPTKHEETSPWMNPFSTILCHDLSCAPCMKRECPLKTHECMKLIHDDEVIVAARVCYNRSKGVI